MAIDYDDKNKFKALIAIIEDYTEWFSRMALYVAYVGEDHIPDNFMVPSSFMDWLGEEDVDGQINTSIIQPIVDMHDALLSVANEMVITLKRSEKPNYQDFIELKNLYSSFLSSLRRLEKDSGMKHDGTDELTGLRPFDSVKQDLNKEMQRLSRNGNPFSLILLRIDQYHDHQDTKAALKITVSNIKKCMRPFDDAYYLESGLFLISLKHADMVGAEAAASRIQQSLVIDEGNIYNVSISCCLAEPVTGDEIDDLLDNMKDDLFDHVNEKDLILKFLDISPLERFIGSKKIR